MHINDLDTPAVLIDLDIMERNLRRWQAHCDALGLANRPHIKTHKIPELARLQVGLGAKGITCQKLGEAEVMADAGLDDILITFNLIGAAKLARAVALARRVRLSVVCDNDVVAEGLSAAFAAAGLRLDVLVEVDTGAGRNGVQTPAEAVALAERLSNRSGIRFAGFMTYPPKGDVERPRAFLAEALALCRAKGLEAAVVSSGGTPDLWQASREGGVTEHRAGTYIFNDRMQMQAGSASLDDCAMTVLATVVSRPTHDRAILDCGSKSLAADPLGPGLGHGHILTYPEAVILRLNEEHGTVDLSRCIGRPEIGERVRVVPNHACVVTNLHDRLWGVRGERVEAQWPVAARGLTG
ncbi:D-TA family PLP-dependent enzyme [Rhodovastum atsumiense]|uniref:D-TA family PLP-dependent enzyme n=1 Tax=Rhodovastum atsumiense TaxID=504468 RepID=A0A5M6IKU0_9PROT|nr:D-TA family PLP-dependent enzyme [Rhodovastum atsumiense]KAA5608537.1 D-TA family PLP-dependent enzyme [Rhodovastum atsumiense]CAH2599992.1 D-TA family PLP-dependent enzyme [Rhodovastum atsumiense]